jgi:hypothetical protein
MVMPRRSGDHFRVTYDRATPRPRDADLPRLRDRDPPAATPLPAVPLQLPRAPGSATLPAVQKQELPCAARDAQARAPTKGSPMRVRQHIPAFFQAEGHVSDAETTADVLTLPWVKSWENNFNGTQFHRWSQVDGNTLMAEYDQGRHWWVVAFVDGVLDLPKWEYVRP